MDFDEHAEDLVVYSTEVPAQQLIAGLAEKMFPQLGKNTEWQETGRELRTT